MAAEITPARISEALTHQVQALSSRIYDLCNCSGIVRIDYILKGDNFYFLEVNTVPGMTETSFIPQQIKAMGLDLTNLLTDIIRDGIKRGTSLISQICWYTSGNGSFKQFVNNHVHSGVDNLQRSSST